MPDWAVPSQYASTSGRATPAESKAPSAACEHELVDPEVPVLAELRAGHADDGHLVLDAVRAHQSSPFRYGRAFQK